MLRNIFAFAVLLTVSYANAGVLGDIDADGQVGLPETIYSLQCLAGLRSPVAIAGNVKVISKYVEITEEYGSETLWIVPTGKRIVITDIYLAGGDAAYLYENTLRKFRIGSGNRIFHFNSGIAFLSGSEVILKSNTTQDIIMFISGYEVDE